VVTVRTQQHGRQEWEEALRLMELRVLRATHRATTRAVHAVERSVKLYLRMYSHPAGTPTPSPHGGPPALVTGALLRSQRVSTTRSIRRGVYSAQTGPTVAYSRIQERGGTAGRNHSVRLPARPYQKPRTRAELGRIWHIYADAWREAQRT
jgi:phage gpG-like protein